MSPDPHFRLRSGFGWSGEGGAASNGRLGQHAVDLPYLGIRPIPPTDVTIFKGSDAWARVGIQRKLGGVATTLDLINPAHPQAPLELIDNRSAAGAAWQSCIGGIDPVTDRLNHFNQSCGNSDQNWGFESQYDIGGIKGIIQKQWLPLFTNDYRHPANPGAPDVRTSPCPNHIAKDIYVPELLGDGRFSIVPELIKAGPSKVLRLTDSYTFRPKDNVNWTQFSFDQCLYLMPGAVSKGNLRVYIAQKGAPVLGPISLSGKRPEELQREVLRIIGNDEDWAILTRPLVYAVLVYNVAGKDIGIAVHQANYQTFTGALRYRAHVFKGVMAEEGPSSHQWHFNLRSDFDPSLKTKYKAGERTTFSVQYDIAPIEELAAEGFPISAAP